MALSYDEFLLGHYDARGILVVSAEKNIPNKTFHDVRAAEIQILEDDVDTWTMNIINELQLCSSESDAVVGDFKLNPFENIANSIDTTPVSPPASPCCCGLTSIFSDKVDEPFCAQYNSTELFRNNIINDVTDSKTLYSSTHYVDRFVRKYSRDVDFRQLSISYLRYALDGGKEKNIISKLAKKNRRQNHKRKKNNCFKKDLKIVMDHLTNHNSCPSMMDPAIIKLINRRHQLNKYLYEKGRLNNNQYLVRKNLLLFHAIRQYFSFIFSVHHYYEIT